MQSYVYNFFKAIHLTNIQLSKCLFINSLYMHKSEMGIWFFALKVICIKALKFPKITYKLKKKASVLFEEKWTFSGKCTKAVEHVKLKDEMKKMNIA